MAKFFTELFVKGKVVVLESKKLNAKLSDIGLAESKVKWQLALADGSEIMEISLGNKTAMENSYYAFLKKGKEQQLVVLYESIVQYLNRPVEEWRSRQLFNLKLDDIQLLVIRKAEQVFELHREKSLWQIKKPLDAQADIAKTRDFIESLLNQPIEKFADETSTDSGRYGLTSPIYTIELSTGNEDKTLLVGSDAADQEGLVYAKFADSNPVFFVKKSWVETLDQSSTKIRDRHIWSMGEMDRVTGIKITNGINSIALEKTNTGWIANGLKANNKKIQRFMKVVGNIQVLNFANTLPEGTATGLDQSTSSIEFTLKNQTSGEPEKFKLVLGQKTGNEIYLLTPLFTTPVTVQKDIDLLLLTKPSDWEELSLNLPKKDQVTSIIFQKENKDIIINKDDKGVWTVESPKGAQVRTESLDKWYEYFSEVMPEAWVSDGGEDPLIMDKALFSIEFLTKDGKTTKLAAYQPLSNKNHLARWGERLFELSEEDFVYLDSFDQVTLDQNAVESGKEESVQEDE
jgi:hypothetical protein